MFSGDRGDAHRGRGNVACNLERLRVSAVLAAIATPDGFVIGMHAGDAWDRVPASRAWIPLRASVGADGVARYLAMHSGGTDPALYLLEVRGGGRARVVWSTPFAAPSEVTPCAGFAGDRLYLVLRDREPDPRTKWRPGRLITVQRDGRAEARTLPRRGAPR
jgi:hypothetical protein